MMTTPHSLLKTQALQQMTQLIKTDGCIGGPAEESSKRLLSAHNDILHYGVEGSLRWGLVLCSIRTRTVTKSPAFWRLMATASGRWPLPGGRANRGGRGARGAGG